MPIVTSMSSRTRLCAFRILETFVDRGLLRQLSQPTRLPNGKRIPGLKIDHPRQLALMQTLVRFSGIAAG